MIPSSRTSSPVPSIPQSLASYLPPTSTDTTPEATVDDAPQCEFDIDWENIWHCGKRLVGVKKRPRHRRVVGTKMKESWIYRHGANLEHKGTELAGDDAIFTLEIVVDGKTRWNSIYVMIKRALELRSAIELYQSRWQKPKNDPVHRDLTKDFLSAVDWAELERFHDFLKPFYILTKTMEGNASKPGAEGGHGAVWETLKTMDYLFVKFKQAAEETQFEEPSHFKSGIDCGWAKLEDYYIKTDRTPIYRAALALHPSYGYDYFERHWKNAMDRPQWYSDMQSAVGSLFDEYVRQAEVETQAQAGLLEDEADEIEADVNDYSSFGKRSIRSLHTQRKKVKAVSDLDLFQTRPIYPQDLDVANPLEWWNRHQLEYPVLYRMALDLFSIPGMSADCERVFSQTKKMITDERNRLAPEVVEADQLQKHWLMRGLVV
ncbi:hypothetical protein FOVSG1_015264 [Fusarium oxysporum f. sp. vasinfectum]